MFKTRPLKNIRKKRKQRNQIVGICVVSLFIFILNAYFGISVFAPINNGIDWLQLQVTKALN